MYSSLLKHTQPCFTHAMQRQRNTTCKTTDAQTSDLSYYFGFEWRLHFFVEKFMPVNHSIESMQLDVTLLV